MKNLILVGSNPRTRSQIPWDDDADYFTLNETPSFPWMKRYDVLFQIHPKWDWSRTNNIADPNHQHYLRAESGTCYYCEGSGRIILDGGPEKACPYCKEGQYILPDHRKGKVIVMQDENDDVPGCIRLPIDTMVRDYCKDGKPYFTSTLAHMLVYAFYLEYDNITLYGFEMESGTEYEHQRACVEYWIGYGRALGITIETPSKIILQGEHYAYTTWTQGYRTRLGLRIDALRQQLNTAHAAAIKSEGALNALNPFKSIPEVTPAWDLAFDEHFKRKNFVSFLNGTIKELENAMQIYDKYYGHEDGQEPEGVKENIGLIYELR